MERYEKLNNKFYSMDLLYGKTNLKPFQNFHCFFILEHPHDEEYIKEQALELLTSQCKNFDFYGKHSKEWDIAFDLVDISLHPDDDDMDIALTSQWDSLDSFVDALDVALSSRTFTPCDIYLIYDDEGTYKRVLNELQPYIDK